MRKLNDIEKVVVECIAIPCHPKNIFLSKNKKILYCTIPVGSCHRNIRKKKCCYASCEESKYCTYPNNCTYPNKCMSGIKSRHVNFDLVKKYAMIKMLSGRKDK